MQDSTNSNNTLDRSGRSSTTQLISNTHQHDDGLSPLTPLPTASSIARVIPKATAVIEWQRAIPNTPLTRLAVRAGEHITLHFRHQILRLSTACSESIRHRARIHSESFPIPSHILPSLDSWLVRYAIPGREFSTPQLLTNTPHTTWTWPITFPDTTIPVGQKAEFRWGVLGSQDQFTLSLVDGGSSLILTEMGIEGEVAFAISTQPKSCRTIISKSANELWSVDHIEGWEGAIKVQLRLHGNPQWSEAKVFLLGNKAVHTCTTLAEDWTWEQV